MKDPPRMGLSDETPDALRAMFAGAERPTSLSSEDKARIVAGAAAIASGAVVTGAVASKGATLAWPMFFKVAGIAGVVVATSIGVREAWVRSAAPEAATQTAAPRSQPARRAPEPDRARIAPQAAIEPERVSAEPPMLTQPTPSAPSASSRPAVRNDAASVAARVANDGRWMPRRAGETVSAMNAEPPREACPIDPSSAGGLASESRALAMATSLLSTRPVVALACVRAAERAGASDALATERLYLGFEASRRAGSTTAARAYATQLTARAPTSAYGVRAQTWLDAQR